MPEPTRFDRVLAILADGARWDVVERLATAGEMPNLRQHFADCGGLRPATSVFPTVSGPAHLPLLSGLHPGRANLPGIRWAERPKGKRGRFLFRTRSYMAPWRAAKLERDIPTTVRTLFHHVPGLADVNTWFVRGCPSRARITRFSKGASFVKALATSDWYASNLQAEAAVGRAWQRGFPSVYAVFPAIDELGHRFGPQTEQSYEAYRRFDASLGRLIEEMRRNGTLGAHAHRDHLGPRADRNPHPRGHRRPDAAFLSPHVGLSQAVASPFLRAGSGPGVGKLDGQPLYTGRDRLAGTTRLRGGRQKPADLVAALLAHPAIAHVIYRRAPEVYVLAGSAGKAVVDARKVSADDATSSAGVGFSVEGREPARLRCPALTA
jgi:hypothetical protein